MPPRSPIACPGPGGVSRRHNCGTRLWHNWISVRFLLPVLLFSSLGFAQDGYDEDYHVFTEAPRLLLTKQRLRLLQREKDRQSMRYLQFYTLITGGAPMPEQGLDWALYYQVAKNLPHGAQGDRVGA